MVNEYKKIVLLEGLMGISDQDFRMVKSLLSKELKLNKKTQDDYDRIQIADLMEQKFPEDSGVDQLIQLYKEMRGLGYLAEKLKREKGKVNRKQGNRNRTAVRRRRRDEPTTSQPMSTTTEESKPESGGSAPNSQAPLLSLATASRRNQASNKPQAAAVHSVQGSQMFPAAPAASSSRISQMFLATPRNSTLAPPVSPATTSSSAQKPRVSAGTPAKKQSLKNVDGKAAGSK